MTPTNKIIISVVAALALALPALPAAASDGYSSVNALTGDPGTEQSIPSDGYTSVNAVTGDSGKQQSLQPGGYSSVNAITGSGSDQSPHSLPSPSVEVREESGFDWGDALIGALVASGLLAFAFVGARSVARHRRATAEPRA
jgi:hypothetical protein